MNIADMTDPRISFRLATAGDVADVHGARAAAADDLVARYGHGHWASVNTPQTIRKHILDGLVHVAENDGIVGTFTLSRQKIVFYRKGWFAHPDDPSLYLTNMAVHPDHQRAGIGRACMLEIERLAREDGCLSIRFDAYDAEAGAGPFYRKCGFTSVHRGPVGTTKLEYFEKVLR